MTREQEKRRLSLKQKIIAFIATTRQLNRRVDGGLFRTKKNAVILLKLKKDAKCGMGFNKKNEVFLIGNRVLGGVPSELISTKILIKYKNIRKP
jgi:hypothetical protein